MKFNRCRESLLDLSVPLPSRKQESTYEYKKGTESTSEKEVSDSVKTSATTAHPLSGQACTQLRTKRPPDGTLNSTAPEKRRRLT